MIHGLSEEEKFKVIRPLLGDHILDQYSMPVIHRTSEEQVDFENMIPIGIQNLTTKEDNSKKLVLPFNYDKNLLKYCELDTYATVKIWEELVRVAK